MNTPPTLDDALSILRWQVEMGADVAIEEVSIDRFATPGPSQRAAGAGAAQAEPPRPPAAEEPRRPRPSGPSAAPALLTSRPDDVVIAAREQAKGAATLEALRAVLEAFEGCALKTTASRLVFADGSPEGRVMFVGEAPGREEDLQGLPFVGRSGQLLDRMLGAIGLDRTTVYIANIVPWRPPGNRTPTPQESAICRPFLERQIELVDPDVLVCLGAPSSQALLGVTDGILRSRGRWLTYDLGRRSIPAMATLHPAYLLRQPLQKRLAWRDFRAIRAALETTASHAR
jgi:uracil-DNA glycosylase